MASAFNMRDVLGELESTKKSGIEMAATLTALKEALDMHTSSTVQLKHVKQETSLTKKIERIEKTLEKLQSDLESGLQSVSARSGRAQGRRGANVMQSNTEESDKVRKIRKEMSALHLELHYLKENLGAIAEAAAAEAEVAASRSEKISEVEAKIKRLEPKFRREIDHGIDHISMALTRMGRSRSPERRSRSRSRSPQASASTQRRPKSKHCNNNNCRPNSPRSYGGATRRRRKRRVTRRK
jgi:hypothetical protein